jgi:hypothetical protein
LEASRPRRSRVEEGLLSKAEALDGRAILGGITALQVVEQTTTTPDHLQQAAATVVILAVRPKVPREVIDAVGQQGNLNLGGAGVLLVLAKILNDLFGCFLGLQDQSPSSFLRSLALALWVEKFYHKSLVSIT